MRGVRGDPALEKAYAEKKLEMTRRLGRRGVNECLFFHGTSLPNSEAILRQNFRLDQVGACAHTSHLPYCTSPSSNAFQASTTESHGESVRDTRPRA